MGGRIQDASRSPPAHSSSRRTRRRRLQDGINIPNIMQGPSGGFCFFSCAPFPSITSLIGFTYAAWLIDVICVDWSSARHRHKVISDMDAGSLDLRSLPQQEVRDCQNAAQDQPKTARKRPKRRQEGPKRAPRRAQKGPKTGPRRPWRASGRPMREHHHVGRHPRPSSGINWASSGLFWGPLWDPSWAENRPKLTPERV